MPNHVTTRCIVTGCPNEIKRFRDTLFVVKQDDGETPYTIFDFNQAIPMPEILKNTVESSRAEEGAQLLMLASCQSPFATGDLYDHQIKRIREAVGMVREPINKVARAYLAEYPEVQEEGKRRLGAITETGYASWYSWSIDNWGTKWNAYDFEIKTNEPLEFIFDTAWSFPDPVFNKIAEMFPTLHFYCVCYDEGDNFAGTGYFNPPVGEVGFSICDASADIYELVHGYPPEREEDDEDADSD